MKNLAIALLEQALADAASHDADIRNMAREFLFSENEAMSRLRAHWLHQAGLPLDSFKRLAHLSSAELHQRLRKTHPNQVTAWNPHRQRSRSATQRPGSGARKKVYGAQEGT